MNKRRMKKMYRKFVTMSLTEKKDYPADGQGLCFFCGKRFPVSSMSDDDWLEEFDGRITALCPYCTMDTVLPDTGHYSMSWIMAAKKYGFGLGR